MFASSLSDQRTGRRHSINLPVRAEWDDETSGAHVTTQGETENVGPQGALVHLERLPDVGSRIQIAVFDKDDGASSLVSAVAEVLRLERNPAQPLAALQLLNASDEWRGLVWEPSAPELQQPDLLDEDELE